MKCKICNSPATHAFRLTSDAKRIIHPRFEVFAFRCDSHYETLSIEYQNDGKDSIFEPLTVDEFLVLEIMLS